MKSLALAVVVVALALTGLAADRIDRLPSTSFGSYRTVPANHVFSEPQYVRDWQLAASQFRPRPGSALGGLPSPRVKLSRSRQLLLQSEILAAAAHAERVAEQRYPINDGDFSGADTSADPDRLLAEHDALFKELLKSSLRQIAFKHGLGLGEMELIRRQSFEYHEVVALVTP